MKDIILGTLQDSVSVKKNFIEQHLEPIVRCADLLVACLASGHKLLIFGNGGSAADAQHLAAEFINRFAMERFPLPAVALTADSSVITSIANDYGFDHVFSRQIAALGKKDDIALGISTSGESPNVLNGVRTAAKIGMRTIGFSGTEGKLKKLVEICLCVPSTVTARIQESHITVGHILCDLTEKILFAGSRHT
jgi:D-sedoheptulose 7-phosphate isomerase